MTEARTQPFCTANNINLGYYDGGRVFPRTVTDRNNALYLYIKHCCLIWKSEKVSFNQAIEELKNIFKIVDKYTTKKTLLLILNMNSYQRKLNHIKFYCI